jgi:hypothetical protein
MTAPKTMPDLCNRRSPFHLTTALMALSNLGVDVHKISLLAVGEYENYRGEVREQEPKAGTTLTADTPIRLKVGFASPIDFMPYQLFYGLVQNPNRSSEWEDDSRRLMAPFDGALIRYLSIANYQELKYTLGFSDTSHVHRFLRLFAFEPDKDLGESSEMQLWAALMPTFHHWAGNAAFAEQLLHLVFGYTFTVSENIPRRFEIPERLRYRLGSKDDPLGRGTIVGSQFTECDSGYSITVSDIPPEQMPSMLPGNPGRQKLEHLLSICLPGHLESDIQLRPSRRTNRLGPDAGTAFLGCATYLSDGSGIDLDKGVPETYFETV